MEEKKNFEAQPSTENENINDKFTTVEECKLHIEDQDKYIKQLEEKLDMQRAELKKTESCLDFYKDYATRNQIKLTFCLHLLKFSGIEHLEKIAEKVKEAYKI